MMSPRAQGETIIIWEKNYQLLWLFIEYLILKWDLQNDSFIPKYDFNDWQKFSNQLSPLLDDKEGIKYFT